MASRKASARAMSPSTWAVNAGVPAAGVKASATRPAGLALRPTAGGVLAGAGLGVGEEVISGNRPDAFPAPMTVVLVAFRSGIGPGGAAGGMAGKRLVAFPGPISVVVALFGRGPGGSFAPRPEVATRPAEPFGEELAVGETDRVGLALGLDLPDAEPVGLALGVGLPDAEPVGLALGVGLPDAEPVGLAVGVGCGDAEPVGLGVDVGVGDVEGAGLALAVDAGPDVDAEGESDADVDGDGLGVLEALRPELVLAAAGEGEGEEVTTLASAGSCVLTDSPQTRKAPVTRPATTARRCARDM